MSQLRRVFSGLAQSWPFTTLTGWVDCDRYHDNWIHFSEATKCISRAPGAVQRVDARGYA
jgi:hypothetical protein